MRDAYRTSSSSHPHFQEHIQRTTHIQITPAQQADKAKQPGATQGEERKFQRFSQKYTAKGFRYIRSVCRIAFTPYGRR